MREIYKLTATHVVTSENHPEGVYSTLPEYPKTFDSRSYNATETNPDGDMEKALRIAKAAFLEQQAAFLKADNRAMWTVVLEKSDGRQIMRDSWGTFPDVTPVIEPEEEVIEPEEPENPEEPTTPTNLDLDII